MNNQEAIALLRNLEDSLDSYCELNEDGKKAFHMAIESLELFGNSEQLPAAQPVAKDINVPSTDCISRQAARSAMRELYREDLERYGIEIPETFDASLAIEAINELPAVRQWIPCSERLPLIEENPVLVSWMGLVNIGWYNPIDGWITGTRFDVDEVDAWMPLPEPWKGGEQDGNS